MPSIIPPSPIEGGAVGISIASGSVSTSSRSASPAPVEEAQDALSPNEDDDDESKKLAQARRKSSIWKKALGIKKRISKVNINDGHRIGGLQSEGAPLSPIEVSPTTVELPPTIATASASGTTVESQPKSSYSIEMDQLEKQIVQNLAELNASSDVEISDNDETDTAAATAADRRSSVDPDAEWKKRVMLQPHCLQTRRSDVSDELVGKVSLSAVAAAAAAANAAQSNIDSSGGACQLRPADLPLFDDATGRPIPPPRQNSSSQRNQRLLSVPNIKYNRSISENARIKAPRKEPISIAANLMRRFSKYLHLERQTFFGKLTNKTQSFFLFLQYKCEVHSPPSP